MRKFVIATSKTWDPEMIQKLQDETGQEFVSITKKEDLTFDVLSQISPEKIFFPHWSYILKPNIYSAFDCVMFHMTDLPYGRGGSPLQNLIVRGHQSTKVSAFRCDGGIDTGPIFLKKDLSLEGSAQEIFERATEVVRGMICEIVKSNPQPIPQSGPIQETFQRRRPEDGDLAPLDSITKIYDFIRMLDAQGYPNAFLKTEKFHFEFTDAKIADGEIIAKVRIKSND